MRLLSISTDPNFIFNTSVGGQSITLIFRWVSNILSWYISILDTSTGTHFVEGKRLVEGSGVFSNLPNTDFIGDIVVYSISGDHSQPRELNAFVDTHRVFYLTEEEIDGL